MEPEVNLIKVKYIITAAIYACYFSFGAGTYLIGPSRYDIADLVSSDFHDVSYGAVTRATGYCTGALVAGFVFARVSRHLGYVTCLSLAALAQLVTPFLRHLYQYLMSELTYGLMSGSIDVATNSWMLEMWEAGANPYMQGMHFSYAVGMTISPLLVSPFLSNKNSSIPYQQTSHILVPYAVTAAAMIAAAGLLLLLYFQAAYVDPKRSISKRHTDHEDGKESSHVYNVLLVVIGSILLCAYTGLELNSFGFISTFAHCVELKLSKSKSALMQSIMSGAFAGSRLISIFAATQIRTNHMLYVSFVLLTCGNTLLLIFANNSQTILWIAIVVMGCGHSCVYPCIMSFLEERMNVTTTACSFFMLASCVSSIVIPILLGNFIESYPLTYVYINLSGLIACLVVFVAIICLDRSASKNVNSSSIN